MPRILIVTPTPRNSRKGNRVTAGRWARLLRSLGHRVRVVETVGDQRCDVLVALHARKSAVDVQRFAQRQPRKPIIVALTGTDLYNDIRQNESAQRSLELASRLVLLQPHGRRMLPPRLLTKVRVIYQSAEAPVKQDRPLRRVFEVCVSGHLRAVKDPFRAAMAARQLPPQSRIVVTHVGGALTKDMQRRAAAEMKRNARYRWLGEVPRWKARRLLARCRLMVLSSRMEGGANVLSEALAADVPVLATRISGSLGLLGKAYSGYFEVGDTKELSRLMYRCENDEMFYRKLRSNCRQRAELVRPPRERSAWRDLLDELLPVPT